MTQPTIPDRRKQKPGYKTTEFWLVIVILAPAVTALVEAIQKGDTFQAAFLTAINAAVGGAYAIARGMAKAPPTQVDDSQPQADPPVIVPGPDKEA